MHLPPCVLLQDSQTKESQRLLTGSRCMQVAGLIVGLWVGLLLVIILLAAIVLLAAKVGQLSL